MRPKLFSTPQPTPSIWPMLFSMAAMMLLLLPTLLMVLSPQKSTALSLSVAGLGDIPNLPSGKVESIVIQATKDGFKVDAKVRQLDVGAGIGDVEERKFSAKDLAELQQVLRILKKIEPKRKRIEIQPDAQTLTEDVVLWMDVLRKDEQGELFPEIIIGRASK